MLYVFFLVRSAEKRGQNAKLRSRQVPATSRGFAITFGESLRCHWVPFGAATDNLNLSFVTTPGGRL